MSPLRKRIINLKLYQLITFRDKTAIVTGGSSGIGRAIAVQIANQEGNVVIVERDSGKLQAVAADHSTIRYVRADLTKPQTYSYIVEAALNHFGSIDILTNCAGILKPATVESASFSDMSEMFQVHVHCPSFAHTASPAEPETYRRTHHKYREQPGSCHPPRSDRVWNHQGCC